MTAVHCPKCQHPLRQITVDEVFCPVCFTSYESGLSEDEKAQAVAAEREWKDREAAQDHVAQDRAREHQLNRERGDR